MNSPVLAARIDPEMVEQLDALAADAGLTRSDLVREGLRLLLTETDGPPDPENRRPR